MQQHNDYCYPWQLPQWQHLLALKKQNAVPHALLLTGQQGIGKADFAQQLAKALLCEQFEQAACGHCKSCYLFAAKTHPDFVCIQAIENSGIIKIDEIRQLIQTAAHVPQQSRYKIIMLDPAEAMNNAAANALLKTLEEPAGNSVFLLISHHLANVSATIRSRTQRLKFVAPKLEQGVAWLQSQLPTAQQVELALRLTDNAPLQARRLLESAQLEQRGEIFVDLQNLVTAQHSLVAIIEKWLKYAIEWVLQVWISWVVDLIRLKSQLHLRYITNQDKTDSLSTLTNFFTLTHLFAVLDKLYKAYQCLLNRSNVNQQLLLENLLVFLLQESNSYA